CVRVMDALGFAQLIARDEGVLEQWTSAQRRTRNDEGEEEYRERGIELPRPIPVRLLYHTAHVENGRVVIVRDAYGWDAAVARALGLPVGPIRAARARFNDLGP
ncbi:MAG TPA: murein L,D-transpeptidase, partial [Allosphingosinicella sp.]|nr:murein L,D-transpeptidase [Allosphingosinicella sp.]